MYSSHIRGDIGLKQMRYIMQTTTYAQHSETFWDRIAPKYAKQPIRDVNAYEEKISKVKQLLKPEDRLLEIGCGTGGTALLLAPLVSEVIATDISRGMIQFANSKLSTHSPNNIRFLQAEANTQISEQSFDVICAFSLLHLVDDIEQVLTSVWEQLKPGGLFISKTVCLKEASSIVRAFVRLLTAIGVAPRVDALSRKDLIRLFEATGFEIEIATHFGQQHRNPFIVARRPAT